MAKEKRGVFHWDPEKKCIVDGPAPLRPSDTKSATAYGGWGGGGIDFQDHPSWADGLKGVKRVASGPHKGRVMFTSRAEAQHLAKLKSEVFRREVRYDP
jgi:hypothetical protein